MGALKRLKPTRHQEMAEFEETRSFYEANRHILLPRYEGKYIAILHGKVIDSDADFSSLAERVYRREGVRDIFMPRVTAEPEVVSIPSPRLEGQ